MKRKFKSCFFVRIKLIVERMAEMSSHLKTLIWGMSDRQNTEQKNGRNSRLKIAQHSTPFFVWLSIQISFKMSKINLGSIISNYVCSFVETFIVFLRLHLNGSVWVRYHRLEYVAWMPSCVRLNYLDCNTFRSKPVNRHGEKNGLM